MSSGGCGRKEGKRRESEGMLSKLRFPERTQSTTSTSGASPVSGSTMGMVLGVIENIDVFLRPWPT